VSKYDIATENDTYYRLDTEAKTLLRTPAPAGEKLAHDNEPITYDTLLSELTIDTPLRVLWHEGDQPKVRTTSLMVEIARA
jgi:hypothetical protein